jgi:hypothetical protein
MLVHVNEKQDDVQQDLKVAEDDQQKAIELEGAPQYLMRWLMGESLLHVLLTSCNMKMRRLNN